MKNTRLVFSLLSILAIQINSCKKIDSGTFEFSAKILGGMVQTTVRGIIVDEFGNKVSGAVVTSGSSTTTSDTAGVFILQNINAYEKLGFVKATKSGYFLGSRSFVPVEGGTNVKIRMLSNKPAGTFTASSGGTISGEGVDVVFQPGTIVKNKVAYTGPVSVSIQFINPTSKNFEDEMPGNLYGTKNNTFLGLTSYGMVGVELKDNSGQPLQLAEGKTATVTFPIPSALQASAPATIDLWSFDEENGIWKHEGSAKKENGMYITQVGHFSFWNCDVPINLVRIDGRVIYASDGTPIQGAKVRITSVNQGTRFSYTNNIGTFGGYIPKNEVLKLDIFLGGNEFSCAQYSTEIGPFSSDVNVQDIAFSPPKHTKITGTVTNCNNEINNNGYIVSNGVIYFTNNGQFSFLDCKSSVVVTAYSSSPFSAGVTQTIVLNGGTINLGNLQTCNGGGSGTVTDIDGNIYATVKIGTQEWMAENLKTSRYRNGDPIPTNVDSVTALRSTTGYWYYYDNDSAKYDVPFGKLYNWYAAVDSRGVCPAGWHVPSRTEWETMISFLGGRVAAGIQLMSKGDTISKTGLWNYDREGTNSTGFSAQPGGWGSAYSYSNYKIIFKPIFGDINNYGFWWSTSEINTGNLNTRVSFSIWDWNEIDLYPVEIWSLTSIRCIRD